MQLTVCMCKYRSSSLNIPSMNLKIGHNVHDKIANNVYTYDDNLK